ncbi:MAG: calcium-binding protein [Hyphomonadaceae bacterium]|nr:calcium-binding protein [Hyphomonadaceae bacterium]
MATFTWKSSSGFAWNTWWDFSGLQQSEDPTPAEPKTSTHFSLVVVAEDVRVEFNGVGFANYEVDGGPSQGTINRIRVYEQGAWVADLNGLSIEAATFSNYVQAGNVSGFLNTVFAGADTFNGNTGADVFFGRAGADTLNGAGGADKLNGENGADTLNGGNGNDTLIGGAQVDTLTGGAGADKFVLNVAGAANRDTITDFVHGTDKVQLENSVFAALGAAGVLAADKFWVGAGAHDASDRVIYNAATGALFYDADGNNAGAKVQIATLDAGLTLTNTDFQVI